jgi:hypothetical protein
MGLGWPDDRRITYNYLDFLKKHVHGPEGTAFALFALND